ncbi:hypothetical protein CRM22_005390 [Opisthorchis felineus]|uniref:UPAR/Ly6 domain-containing protein n=1 Tax=Opisthorchis felineus TaxID=147828 RepID=A0A4S2LRD0_OPIFE|nr:hypothetical protein CRM22_005390 [Opisthorchis felineus]
MMRHCSISVFFYLALQAVSSSATVNCYTCQNCNLPIADGTTVSTKPECQKCKIEFTLGQSGGPTGVNATCETGSTCQASYNAKVDSVKVVSCCDTEKCNSLPGISAIILPNYLPILMAFLVSL